MRITGGARPAASFRLDAGGFNHSGEMGTLPATGSTVRFMEKDSARQAHWLDLQLGQMPEELLLEAGEERRICHYLRSARGAGMGA